MHALELLRDAPNSSPFVEQYLAKYPIETSPIPLSLHLVVRKIFCDSKLNRIKKADHLCYSPPREEGDEVTLDIGWGRKSLLLSPEYAILSGKTFNIKSDFQLLLDDLAKIPSEGAL